MASCVRYLRRSFRRYYPQTALGSRIRCFRWSKNNTFCFVLFQIDQFGKSMHFKWCGLMAWFPAEDQVPLEATIAGKKIWRYCCSHHIRIAPVHHRCHMSGLLYQKPPLSPSLRTKTQCNVLSKPHLTQTGPLLCFTRLSWIKWATVFLHNRRGTGGGSTVDQQWNEWFPTSWQKKIV